MDEDKLIIDEKSTDKTAEMAASAEVSMEKADYEATKAEQDIAGYYRWNTELPDKTGAISFKTKYIPSTALQNCLMKIVIKQDERRKLDTEIEKLLQLRDELMLKDSKEIMEISKDEK